ncbi:monooxygenase family protein [Bacillus rhizoplanae]
MFHETFVVEKGQYESLYANMPLFGLTKAGTSLPVSSQRGTARARMKP